MIGVVSLLLLIDMTANVCGCMIYLISQGADQRADYHDIMDRIHQVYEHLEEIDAATAEARACSILAGLGFTRAMQAKKTREFSGGWRMRIALARALFISVSHTHTLSFLCVVVSAFTRLFLTSFHLSVSPLS